MPMQKIKLCLGKNKNKKTKQNKDIDSEGNASTEAGCLSDYVLG